MLDKKSAVIYVGKAKDLFKRLSSYAHHKGAEHSKTGAMLARVARVDTIITNTEKEALILEASLIKKHRPRYNIILRDDKSYPLIKVSLQDEWPQVLMTRRRKKDGARYFGPYANVAAMWETLKLIGKLFPLRRCKGSTLRPRSRPCLNHQMGRCLAPCAGLADRSQYLQHVAAVQLILEGRNRELSSSLEEQMQQAAEDLRFEDAACLRDTVAALKHTLEKQVVLTGQRYDQDVFGFARQGTAVALAILSIREGAISGSRQYFLHDPYGDDAAILTQSLLQFYDQDSYFPREILLPLPVDDDLVLQDRLSELAGSSVKLLSPQRGEKLTLINMAIANARQIFAEKEKKEQSWQGLAGALQEKLQLQRQPHTIECLDISTISGQLAVGSLVCFRHGEADPGRFRHFRIKTVDGPDDYAMMREVLQRRLQRGLDEDSLPDLFVVDGGRGQLGVAMGVADDLGIRDRLDWLGIAKERDEEGEKLYKPGRKNPILLARHDPALLYLMRIRDEAHRYGITFHRRLRQNSTLISAVAAVAGIGSDRQKLLLRHFGSVKRIRQASLAELQEVAGIGKQLAAQIFQHFHSDNAAD